MLIGSYKINNNQFLFIPKELPKNQKQHLHLQDLEGIDSVLPVAYESILPTYMMPSEMNSLIAPVHQSTRPNATQYATGTQ